MQARREMHSRAAEAAAKLPRTHKPGPEAELLAACQRFNEIERQKIGLLKTGHADELHNEIKLARLGTSQALSLEEICTARATTIHGHRARAFSYALWDSGELEYRVSVGATIEDLLLQALVRDLTGGS